MTRQKIRVKQFVVAVSKTQLEALQKMMTEDMQESVSQYFGMMIAEITNSRAGRKRGAVGRPRKSETGEGEEVKWFPCPYDETAPPYTMDDLVAYYTFRNEKVPAQPPAYSKEQLKKWDM